MTSGYTNAIFVEWKINSKGVNNMLYVIIIWTLVAVILHFSDVGKFKNWPVIAWPWRWSCLCLLEWCLFILAVLLMLGVGLMLLVPIVG